MIEQVECSCPTSTCTKSNYRFEVPEKFELETKASAQCLQCSEIQGKKLWLIQAPKEVKSTYTSLGLKTSRRHVETKICVSIYRNISVLMFKII